MTRSPFRLSTRPQIKGPTNDERDMQMFHALIDKIEVGIAIAEETKKTRQLVWLFHLPGCATSDDLPPIAILSAAIATLPSHITAKHDGRGRLYLTIAYA